MLPAETSRREEVCSRRVREDSPWRSPSADVAAGAGPAVPGVPRLLTWLLLATLAVSVVVQLWNVLLWRTVVEVADGIFDPHRIQYDPEDNVGFAFIFGFGGDLLAALITGTAWLVWLRAVVRRHAPGGSARGLFALHFVPVVQIVAPYRAWVALGADRVLRTSWLASWLAAFFLCLTPAWGRLVLPLVRARLCDPRWGTHGGEDWCKDVFEAYAFSAGALLFAVAALIAIVLVRKIAAR